MRLAFLALILLFIPIQALAEDCKKEEVCALVGKMDHFSILDKCPNAAKFLVECKQVSETSFEELPAPKFVDNKDGTVTDTVNKLLWLKKGVLKKHNFKDAKNFAASANEAGKTGWRLPTLPEIRSLMVKDRVSNVSGKKAYVHPVFDDDEGHYYWSTTSCTEVGMVEDRYQKKICQEGDKAVWLVHFNINAIFWHYMDGEYFVWLVQEAK